MKKVKLLLSVVSALAAVATLNSCKKEYSCCKNGYCETIRKSDYANSQTLFNAEINALKAAGYSCK